MDRSKKVTGSVLRSEAISYPGLMCLSQPNISGRLESVTPWGCMGELRFLISFAWFDFAMHARNSIVPSGVGGSAAPICASVASSGGERNYTFSGRTAVRIRLKNSLYYCVL